MKKFIVFMALILSTVPAFAETMAVQSVTSIATDKKNEIVKVRVIRDCKLDNIELKEGYILEGKITSVTDPKRLKQNAKFTFSPTTYYNNEGVGTHISKLYMGEYTPKFEVNPAKAAKSAALSVGNHFVKGLSAGYYAVEGAVHNEEGNRAVSAAENVYKNSLFSFLGKGEQLHLEPNTCFGLEFNECINEKE